MDDKLRAVVSAALTFAGSEMYYEMGHNADDPHMDASLEMHEDMLTDAIAQYVIDRERDQAESYRR